MNARLLTTALLSLATAASAQPASGQGMACCDVSGGMGWSMMPLGGAFTVAVIAALIALTIFLVRRSRPPGSART